MSTSVKAGPVVLLPAAWLKQAQAADRGCCISRTNLGIARVHALPDLGTGNWLASQAADPRWENARLYSDLQEREARIPPALVESKHCRES